VVYSLINPNNSTCFYHLSQEPISSTVIHIDYRWLVLGQLLYGIGVQLIITCGIEFVCAQAPYSMKGSIIGIGFLPTGLSIAICQVLLKFMHNWTRNSGIDCDIWLNGSLLLFTVFYTCIAFIVARKFPLRKREEVLNNDQMFAVDYYNKYLATNDM